MNITSQIRQQTKDFANLTTDNDRSNFLNTQREVFLAMSPEEKLEHFKAIQQRTEELKQSIQKPVLV